MGHDRLEVVSRQLLILAFLASIAAASWADRTPVAPNSDRYDYAGRALHLRMGSGPNPGVAYPLRFAFEGAEQLPPQNLTRPPLWPVLLAPPQSWGLDDRAGVWVGWAFVAGLLLLIRTATDRSFGAGAGGFAALAVAGSFALTRALWGGGPEPALAALIFLLWTWAPAAAGTTGYVACGATYALLPWLHPVGIFYGALAFVARSHRYSRRGRVLVASVGIVLSLPWYVQVGRVTGQPLGPLQSVAELARATDDPGGLGPYRELVPRPSTQVLRDHFGPWLRESRHRLRLQIQGLDAWWSWPLVLLALVGGFRDPRLALRDCIVGVTAVLVVSALSFEARLLLPLLPVAASWAGAGFLRIAERWPRLGHSTVPVVLVVAPWLLPMGATPRPGAELDRRQRELAVPEPDLLRAVGTTARDGAVLFVDDAVVAYRARTDAVLLPAHPADLQNILHTLGRPPADAAVVLAEGRDSWALRANPTEWDAWLDAAAFPISSPDTALRTSWRIARPAAPTYVPPALGLTAEDVPADLVPIPVPPASRKGLQLEAGAWTALQRLLRAAQRDQITLRVISAYRSYEYQRELYDRAVAKYGPQQEWVAAPGRSEHQLGTTVDLADAALEHQVDASFAQTPEGQWLRANCEQYGWVISYTDENRALTGYQPEPWHIRFRGETK